MTKAKKISAIIVEDEMNAKIVLEKMLARYTTQVDVIETCKNVKQAIESINALKPELVFLDIQMPDGTGFDVLEQVEYKLFNTIFVTAFDHFAIKAIKFHAFDYLLKPVDYIELRESVNRLDDKLNKEAGIDSFNNYVENLKTKDKRKYKIAVPNKDGQVFIIIADIVRFEADKSYTWIYKRDGEKFLSSKNLGEFAKVLPSVEDYEDFFFFRIHHGHIINTNYIVSYDPKSLMVGLNDGIELSVSRRRKGDFQTALKLLNEVL